MYKLTIHERGNGIKVYKDVSWHEFIAITGQAEKDNKIGKVVFEKWNMK